jgi:hypothetical protein
VNKKQPTSAQHMWEILQDCWKSIPGDYLMNLAERMPKVCKAVIKARLTTLKNLKYKYIWICLTLFLVIT